MRRFWIMMAGIGLGVALVALWLRHTDVAFVAATLGAVAWILNYRIQIKESIAPLQKSDDEGMNDLDEEESDEKS